MKRFIVGFSAYIISFGYTFFAFYLLGFNLTRVGADLGFAFIISTIFGIIGMVVVESSKSDE